MAEVTYRMDRNDITSSFVRTDEGLVGTAIVTNIGVFQYLEGGKIVREVRLPEDVFAPESIATLIGKPLINDHPASKKLLKDTSRQDIAAMTIGMTGENPVHTELYLGVDLKVTREDGIRAVEMGKTSLSAGYNCIMVDESGVFLGMPYDRRQTEIRYDHVALVPGARAGDKARIRMDGMPIEGDEVVMDETITKVIPGRNAMAEPTLKTVKLDGVDYQAEAKVLEALHGTQTRLDAMAQELSSAKADATKVQAERDSLKERMDATDKELSELKKTSVDASKLNEMVRARVELETFAKLNKIEIKLDQSDLEIMTAIVKAKSPEAKLDGKDPVYIQARFDLLKETVKLDAEGDAASRLAGDKNKDTKLDASDNVAEAARAKYLERLRKAHVAPAGEK